MTKQEPEAKFSSFLGRPGTRCLVSGLLSGHGSVLASVRPSRAALRLPDCMALRTVFVSFGMGCSLLALALLVPTFLVLVLLVVILPVLLLVLLLMPALPVLVVLVPTLPVRIHLALTLLVLTLLVLTHPRVGIPIV